MSHTHSSCWPLSSSIQHKEAVNYIHNSGWPHLCIQGRRCKLQPQLSVPYSPHSPKRRWKLGYNHNSVCHIHGIHQKDAENWLQPQFSVPYSPHLPERRWKLATATVQCAILTALTTAGLQATATRARSMAIARPKLAPIVLMLSRQGRRCWGWRWCRRLGEVGRRFLKTLGFCRPPQEAAARAVVTWSCHWTPWTRITSALSRPRPRRPVGRGLRFPSVSVCTPYVELLLE